MTFVKSLLAVLVGFIVGSLVNMAIVVVGSSVIPAPPGVDVTDADSMASSMHLFETRHFVFPLLAHALGTLVGAALGGYIGWRHRKAIVWMVSLLFFCGGVATVFMIPAPIGFIVTDLLFAYAPMAIVALWALDRFFGGAGDSERQSIG